jgi:hypothetical protein
MRGMSRSDRGSYFFSSYPTNHFLSFIFNDNQIKNTLEIHITVKSESTNQIASINPKPLIIFIPKTNRITATKSHVRFESQIADQDSLNQ